MNTIFSNIRSRAVVDYRISPQSKITLENMGYHLILTKKVENLYDAVDGHVDMQLFVADNKIIVAPEVYNYYYNFLGENVVCGAEKLRSKYPFDILYNAAYVGEFIICNKAHTAPEILEFAKNANKSIIDVKQGYSKCSVGIIGKNAIVTADITIAKKCSEVGIDTLLIDPGHIELKGMEYGFIGGTCGMIADNIIAFNGELNTHPQGKEIIRICNKHKIEVIELKKGPLEDIGSIFTI